MTIMTVSVSTYFLLQNSLVETMRGSVILLFTVLALAFLVVGVSIHIAGYHPKQILKGEFMERMKTTR